MRDLQQQPIWRGEDLGRPLPDSADAVSVALPRWEHVIGYEEKKPEILARLKCGYPRFFCHECVTQLFAECEKRFAGPDEACLAFPAEQSAQRCVAFIASHHGSTARAAPFGFGGVHAVAFPKQAFDVARLYWRYSGEIISSRLARAALHGGQPDPAGRASLAVLRARIAEHAGQPAENVYLFPSGMAAVFAVQRMLQSIFPQRRSIQLEFPYVDVLRVQKEFGLGAEFYPALREEDWMELRIVLEHEKIAGVYTEHPSNPLMRSVDLERLSKLLNGAPLIIDDTVGTSVNVDAFRFADAVTTSLTKYFCGTGDVIAGALTLNTRSKLYERFREFLAADFEELLWGEDARALEAESRDYPERVRRINQNAAAVYEYLAAHPKVERCWYPLLETKKNYDQIKRPAGGYSGLMSILLKDSGRASPLFYDNLAVSKGPSLGLNFTLACPYTLLAHYEELDWAERCGCPRNLIRLSIGLEDPAELIERFASAFERV